MKSCLDERAEADLDSCVERWIEQRTGGRVHHLRVERIGGRVIVHGQTGSYYVRQLVLAAAEEALEALESELPEPLELDVRVCV